MCKFRLDAIVDKRILDNLFLCSVLLLSQISLKAVVFSWLVKYQGRSCSTQTMMMNGEYTVLNSIGLSCILWGDVWLGNFNISIMILRSVRDDKNNYWTV